MQHLGTALIETNRLILRKFRLDDSEATLRNWTSDDRVTEFLRWSTHQNIETTEKIIKMWVDGYSKIKFYQWAIVLKTVLMNRLAQLTLLSKNEELNILHIGYCIGSRWWNKGITSEAFSGVISFLFEQVKANKIESQHDPRNPNSGKVMMKCGLKYEGTLREKDVSNKGIVDAAMYSMLAKEYFA